MNTNRPTKYYVGDSSAVSAPKHKFILQILRLENASRFTREYRKMELYIGKFVLGVFLRTKINKPWLCLYFEYRYDMGSEQLQWFEGELQRLASRGYRWEHAYTQCVLQAMLYTLRQHL